MKVPLLCLLILAGSYFGGSLGKLSDARLVAFFGESSPLIWKVVLAGGLAGLAFAMAGRVRALVARKDYPKAGFELACGALLVLLALALFHDNRNALQSSRPLMARFAAAIPPGVPVAIYGRKEPEVLYYLDRGSGCLHLDYPDPVPGKEPDPDFLRLESFLRQETPAFLVTSRAELDLLKSQFASLEPILQVKEEGRGGGGRDYVLVSNGR
jgi:hypothetical protein